MSRTIMVPKGLMRTPDGKVIPITKREAQIFDLGARIAFGTVLEILNGENPNYPSLTHPGDLSGDIPLGELEDILIRLRENLILKRSKRMTGKTICIERVRTDVLYLYATTKHVVTGIMTIYQGSEGLYRTFAVVVTDKGLNGHQEIRRQGHTRDFLIRDFFGDMPYCGHRRRYTSQYAHRMNPCVT